MLLLAIESAGLTSSVALLDRRGDPDGGIVAYRELGAGRQHADRLVLLIEDALGDAGVDYPELDALAVDHGPGSFTGVRTAVAAARALALATGVGVLAVNSLEALAWTAASPDRAGTIVAALDARRGEVYVQAFANDLRPLVDPAALTPEAAARVARGPMVLVGSGAPLVLAALAEDVEVEVVPGAPDARAVALCAAHRIAAGKQPTAGFALRPLYLRAPDARPQGSRAAETGAQAGAL